MNILLFIDSLGGGGSQRQLANLAIGLQQRGCTVTVLTYDSFENHLPRIEAAGVRYECLHKGFRFDLTPAIKLARRIRQCSPAIVIAFLRTPALYAEMARIASPGVPLLVSERAGLINDQLRLSDKVGSVLHLAASGVIANSHAYADGMTAFLPFLKPRTSVIYNGVDAAFFANGKQRINANALNRGSNDHSSHSDDEGVNDTTVQVSNSDKSNSSITRFVVVAARPSEEKGVRTLAHALGIVKKAGVTNFQVDWIGPADNQDAQVKATNALLTEYDLQAHWAWVGHRQNINECYNDYDALICPSLHEGVPNVVCEAMASALPVIATQVGDNVRIMDTTSHGLYCEAGNPHELANSIVCFLSLNQKSRRQIGENVHYRAQALFAMDNYINSWESAIKRHL